MKHFFHKGPPFGPVTKQAKTRYVQTRYLVQTQYSNPINHILYRHLYSWIIEPKVTVCKLRGELFL